MSSGEITTTFFSILQAGLNPLQLIAPRDKELGLTPEEIPDLQWLAANNVKGVDISEQYLIPIIIKAQPHHTEQSLAHLSTAQLVAHIDALVEWWKQANPRKASVVCPDEELSYRSGSIRSSTRSIQEDPCCCIIS